MMWEIHVHSSPERLFAVYYKFLSASGPEVPNRVCSAALHLFHTVITTAVPVFNTNQLAF